MTDGFRKFDFDREFAPDGRILREGDTFKRVYTEEEMQMVAEQAAEAARQVENDVRQTWASMVAAGERARQFAAQSDANIEVDMILQNVGRDGLTDFTFTVHRNDFEQASKLLEKTAGKLKARKCKFDDRIAKVAIVGAGMRSHAGVAATAFKALAEKGINIRAITTSEIKISILIDQDYVELAVRTLHSLYGLDKE